MEYLLSFAQDKEDIILYHLLKNVTVPIRYIDVGANDPIKISVTKFFYDRGASGVNIEPQRELVERLNRDRPRDINLAVGVSNKAGELTLHGEGVGATFGHDNGQVSHQKEYTVPVVTLSDVFNKYVSKNEDIHFLKLDVEGWERECLEGMDFVQFRPWILCIEAVNPSYDTYYKRWEDLVVNQNYVLLGASGANRYYAAEERVRELQEFRQPNELDSIYIIIRYEECMINLSLDKFILHKCRATIGPALNRTPLGQKVKASILKSFIWQKVLSRRY